MNDIIGLLRKVKTDGTQQEEVADGRDANISPDGRIITFRVTNEAYWRDEKKMKQIYNEKAGDKRPIWVMNVDGSNARIVEVLHYQCAMDGSRAEVFNLK